MQVLVLELSERDGQVNPWPLQDLVPKNMLDITVVRVLSSGLTYA